MTKGKRVKRTRKKKGKGNSGKGSGYERQICKLLSMWWTHDERDDVFWRTSQSGGRATTRQKKGLSTAGGYGDLCATDPIGKPLTDVLTFELKRGYSTVTIQDMLDRKPTQKESQFEGFIQQAIESANQAGTYWAVITRRNSRVSMIWLDQDFVDWFNDDEYLKDAPIVKIFRDPEEHFIGITLKDFIARVTPQRIKGIAFAKQISKANKKW